MRTDCDLCMEIYEESQLIDGTCPVCMTKKGDSKEIHDENDEESIMEAGDPLNG